MSEYTTATQTYQVSIRIQDGMGDMTQEIEAADLAAAEEMAAEMADEFVRDGEWGNDGASVGVRWAITQADEDGDEVELASDGLTVEIEPDHDSLIRKAGGDPDCDHEWTSEGEGGCDENPGVWSHGGTSMSFASHCRTCGLHRVEHHCGSQRNPGEHDTVEYSMPDAE